MKQVNPILMNQLRKDYELLKQVGSPLLSCQGMLVPRGWEHLRILIKSSMRPTVSNGEPAEVQYAGGLTGIVAGVPMTKYSGTLQMIATEAGHDQFFAEWLSNTGGMVHCDYFDGRLDSFLRFYELENCAIRFDQAEFDTDNRSQAMIISCPYDYNFFGSFATKGRNETVLPGQREIAGVQEFVDRVQSVVNSTNTILNATNQISGAVGAIGSLFG